MSITDIENKTFAELKAEREALTDQAKGEPVDVLARHYVRARMDATQRDEKLAEQGRTITALQSGLEASMQQANATQDELTRCQATLETVRETARETTLADKTALGKTIASLQKETERADRLKALSNISRAAVVKAAATLNEAINQMTTEAADQGE